MSVKLTSENYENEVVKDGKNVLIDFWASWCVPCRMMLPVIDEIANELKSVKVCKVNVDEQPELAQRFHVMAIPTLVVLKGGEIKERMVGLRRKEEIVHALGE